MKVINTLRNIGTAAAVASLAMFWTGCRKDKIQDYDIPATYTFDNVKYSGQTERLNMLSEMSTYMKTGNTPGTLLDAQTLRNMFENANDPFSFVSTKQLKDKCFLPDQATFDTYFDQLAAASQSTVPGADGTAGVVYSLDSAKKYLFDANGWEYTQLIEKGLMGAVFYYQATAVYLSESGISEETVDNEQVTAGEGTMMEHHWDEAFGYFGVPKDFPANTTGIVFWGKYANDRNGLLECNTPIMNAFIKGRAAISNDDHATKWNQIEIISDTWERVIASTAIHYFNEAKTDLADDALRNHALTEAVAFVKALKYNPSRRITDTQISTVTGAVGNNLYQVTVQGLDNARNTLSSIYGLDSIKDQL